MNEPSSNTEIFDVFLCHNSEDKPAIRNIARKLTEKGITPWLDEEQIRPGTSWQTALGNQINRIKSAAVFVGESGLGPWQDQEIQALLSQFVKRKCPVIPIVLPSAKETPYLPWTLQNLHWVDFRVANPDPLEQLIWGIRGEKSKDLSKDSSSSLTTKLAQEQHPPGSLFGDIPEPPPHYLHRPEFLNGLKEKILQADEKPIGIMSSEKVGISGMGGIGKTVLASVVVRDQEIKNRFSDGIFWLTFGQEPNIILRQTQLAKELSGESESFTDIQEGKSRLKQLLEGRSSLIVLDDLWEMSHLRAFNVLGPTCKMLMTTRNASLIKGLGAEEFGIDVLSPSQARNLLSNWAKRKGLPTAAHPILKECGYLPLAVAMIGAILRGKEPDRWEDTLVQLKNADLKKISQHFPDYPYPSLFKALQVSVDNLEERLHRCYRFFAIFPEDVHIPPKVLYMLWSERGLNERDCKDYIDGLVDLSLLQRDTQGRLYPHDLQRDYLRVDVKDKLQLLHQELLDAYGRLLSSSSSKPNCDISRWANGPKDGYFFENLCYHLFEASRFDELKNLLLNFDWLQTKLDACEIIKLISDYRFLVEDSDLKKIWHALQLSAHILSNDRTQLPSQLLGRLGDEFSYLVNLINGIHVFYPWIRPLRASLMKAGGALIRVLEGHVGTVDSVVVSADGRIAISGSEDKTLRVWDLQSGEQLQVLKINLDILSVAASADGRIAISGHNDGTLRVWDLQTGDSLHVLTGYTNSLCSVAVSAEGRIAVSGSEDKTLQVWDLQSGELEHIFKGHSDTIYSVSVSADGRIAVSGSRDKTLRVWDLQCLKPLNVLKWHSNDEFKRLRDQESELLPDDLKEDFGEVNSVAVSADGRIAVSGHSDGILLVWSLQSGELQQILKKDYFSLDSVAVNADGRIAVSVSGGPGLRVSTLQVWNLQSGEVLQVFNAHPDEVYSVSVSADGRIAVSGSNDKTLRVWDLQSVWHTHDFKEDFGEVYSVSVSADGRVAISGHVDGTLRVWDLQSGELLHVFNGHSNEVYSVSVSADGRIAVSGSNDKTLRVWDLQSGKPLHVVEGHDGLALANVVISDEGRIAVAVVEENNSHTNVMISDDGRIAVSDHNDATLRVWDFEIDKSLHVLKGCPDKVFSVAFSADSSIAVYKVSDIIIRVRNLNYGEPLHVLKWYSDDYIGQLWDEDGYPFSDRSEKYIKDVNSIAVSADGRVAISGHVDGTLRVWNLQSAEPLHVHEGLSESVVSVAVNADGSIAVSGHNDGTLQVWDVKSGESLHVLKGHSDNVLSVEINADGSIAVSGSEDKTLRVWDLKYGKLIATFYTDAAITSISVDNEGLIFVAKDAVRKIHFLSLKNFKKGE